MTDVTYATNNVSCVELPLCQYSAAPIFAEVHMEFIIACLSVTLNISATNRILFMKFDFVGFFEYMSKLSSLIKPDKDNEYFT